MEQSTLIKMQIKKSTHLNLRRLAIQLDMNVDELMAYLLQLHNGK